MALFRYLKPGYVALNVTDPERSIRFYRDLVGLQLESCENADIAFLRCSDDHHNLVLYRSTEPGVRRMAFQLESDNDLQRAREHVASQGWPLQTLSDSECAHLRQGDTFRFRIPGFDLQFEFYARIARATSLFQPTVAKIVRLGHVVVGARNADDVRALLVEKLNFRVSDKFGDQVMFLRCFPNVFHHSFGIAKSEDVDRLHHLNFMVTDVDDIGRAMNRMREHGVQIVYGPGRHDISDSIFIYFLDPDGMTAEYSFGMEEFRELTARDPRELPMLPEILDCWGGKPAPDFGKRGLVDQSA
ncbi:VOC family protein [Caballeronia sp. dw_19]|uniref:VOC family protein n=1 Tax=Caballeronia sp. dw_19 TaxID=2719791 RepID=UPI001BD21EDE|nr:VOC family protein [Caballeronia sp. dw_19]